MRQDSGSTLPDSDPARVRDEVLERYACGWDSEVAYWTTRIRCSRSLEAIYEMQKWVDEASAAASRLRALKTPPAGDVR